MIRKDVSTGKSTMNVNNQQADDLENLNKRSESHIPQTHISDRVTQGQKETVKHTVYQTCRTTSTSSKILCCFNFSIHSHIFTISVLAFVVCCWKLDSMLMVDTIYYGSWQIFLSFWWKTRLARKLDHFDG